MLILKIILGLAGLGVVVFVHELGHFLAARFVGIDVEAFSIGWGKPILKKKIGTVEYRIGMFPVGGYCKMRGENEFQEAFEKKQKEIPQLKGTYYGTSPLRRIVVSFAGPFFNLIFAVLVYSIIWGIGFEVNTLENRIVLASDINPEEKHPADEAGFRSGDRIVRIDGREIANYHDIQEAVAPNAEKNLSVTVERDGETEELQVRPALDKNTGAGKIGVYFWTDPVIAEVAAESPAAIAGLMKGDRILRVNGREFPYSVAMLKILRESPAVLYLEYERGGSVYDADVVLTYTDGIPRDIGVSYETVRYRTSSYSPLGALAKGAAETWKTFAVSLRSLALLFRGIDLTQAVSGPVRITYMVGDAAAEGFGQSFGAGVSSMINFLSLISIALCVMNLLPLPVLDGGMILLFIIEAVMGHPLRPKTIYMFQTVGVVLIIGLMLFAVFGDILFLVRR
ncbi:MAG: site-2 protease family protein [Spirochaetaceae bacterium]|jgi:regulator of sigma E protease|nr:site-2 protease family protein [Spirochaetaceae bacterium]